MRLTCTACGAHGSIEQFTSDGDARKSVELVSGLPADLGPVVVRYLGLFRPMKRGLTWDRVLKISGEIVEMINQGAVEQRGKRFPATPDMFAAAMQQMLDTRERLDLPMSSHGYLIKIVAGESPREAARTESAQEELKRMESSQRVGSHSRAVAELSGEIARRKRFAEPDMTTSEREAYLRSHLDGENDH